MVTRDPAHGDVVVQHLSQAQQRLVLLGIIPVLNEVAAGDSERGTEPVDRLDHASVPTGLLAHVYLVGRVDPKADAPKWFEVVLLTPVEPLKQPELGIG